MDGQEPVDSLHLDEEHMVDHQVESIAAIEKDPLVAQRDRSLALDQQPAQLKLMSQAPFVGGLEQPWTQVSVHFDARADDNVRAIPKSSRLPVFLSHSPLIVRSRLQVASAKMFSLPTAHAS
jgi:hypothetical protein